MPPLASKSLPRLNIKLSEPDQIVAKLSRARLLVSRLDGRLNEAIFLYRVGQIARLVYVALPPQLVHRRSANLIDWPGSSRQAQVSFN